MRRYDLAKGAETDLRDILRYTLKEWGVQQVRYYQCLLTAKLDSIAAGEVSARQFSKNLPEVLVTRCEHHYVFYTAQNRARPLIIAILHERQDLVARLADRLDGPN
jgi:toxin ParE1/3/4